MDAINGYMTDEIIITKAKELGHKLNVGDLQFSKGWLYRFKNRFNLKLKVLHGEANSMNDVDVSANRKKMVEKLAGIDLEVILNLLDFFSSISYKNNFINRKKRNKTI